MRRALKLIGIASVYLAMAGCQPPPEAPDTAPAVANPPPPPEALRRAAAQVLSSDCGNSWSDPGYKEHAQMLDDAGPAVIPVLTEMVGDHSMSVWFVHRAASTAAKFPFDKNFRQALRDRRDDPKFQHNHGARLGVFSYFADYGDITDLAWMERAAESLSDSCRKHGDEEIRKLRARLEQLRAAVEADHGPFADGVAALSK